jgi:hypothetical protein
VQRAGTHAQARGGVVAQAFAVGEAQPFGRSTAAGIIVEAGLAAIGLEHDEARGWGADAQAGAFAQARQQGAFVGRYDFEGGRSIRGGSADAYAGVGLSLGRQGQGQQ